jgi:fructokinase
VAQGSVASIPAGRSASPPAESELTSQSGGAWPSVICLGEVLIDFVATDSGQPLSAAPTFIRAPGGAPANVAVAVSRLGNRAAFVGKIATDMFGRFLRETLAIEAVDLRGLVEDPSTRTALAFIGSDGNAGRAFVFYHEGMADTSLRVDDLGRARELIEHAKLFHFGSVTLSAEPSVSATLEAATYARRSGCLVSFDPNVRLELWDSPSRAHQTTMEALRLVDVLKVSNDELEFLAGTTDPVEACCLLRARGPRLVAVTLGSDGCYYDAGSSCGYVPGVHVNVVDTLGAGDAFLGGLLVGLATSADGLLDDRPALIQALHFANAVGALTTTRYGAIPALPRLPEVEALLSSDRNRQQSSSSY